jgi:hypothetical protein
MRMLQTTLLIEVALLEGLCIALSGLSRVIWAPFDMIGMPYVGLSKLISF